MTRETKVGLLVGLAFIIVIGILLSDYNRINPEPASLTAVNSDLNKGAATPHNGSSHDEIVLPPAALPPARAVLTHEELRDQSTKIAIGPATGNPVIPSGNSPPVVIDNGSGRADISAAAAGPQVNPGARNGDNDLQRTARQFGDDIVPAGSDVPSKPPANSAPPTVNGARQYIAVSGDTLSKLAGRFLGANTKANRQAIIAVNPSLKQNPNNVIVGKTYMIPPRPSAAKSGAPVPTLAESPAPVVADNAPSAQASDTKTVFYTVKDNDSLWRIAEEELGDGTQWMKIRDMNQDVLKGKDNVRKNMKLRLPQKTVASTDLR